MRQIRMPSPAENVDAVTLGAWRVMVGDAVAAGDAIADLVTEKAAFPLEADAGGIVSHLLATPGSTLPPGVVIALMDAAVADYAEALAENERRLARFAAGPSASAHGASGTAQAVSETPRAAPGAGNPVRATPAARRLAKELGLSLEAIAARHPPGTLLREEHIQ